GISGHQTVAQQEFFDRCYPCGRFSQFHGVMSITLKAYFAGLAIFFFSTFDALRESSGRWK
ncbi:MAG: hypothetical protein E7I10_24525, partial [Enterobacter asburiae]|nr:hypothetical protein [Enterobacter asburiae]